MANRGRGSMRASVARVTNVFILECAEKRIFETKEAAESFEKANREEYGYSKRNAYKCPHADHWHLLPCQQTVDGAPTPPVQSYLTRRLSQLIGRDDLEAIKCKLVQRLMRQLRPLPA